MTTHGIGPAGCSSLSKLSPPADVVTYSISFIIGDAEGDEVGLMVGDTVGNDVADDVGLTVGLLLGESVGLLVNTLVSGTVVDVVSGIVGGVVVSVEADTQVSIRGHPELKNCTQHSSPVLDRNSGKSPISGGTSGSFVHEPRSCIEGYQSPHSDVD